ncbi:hypothetical protein [Paraburkholderia bannensis]|uniref:hypothetical protein n=1 Tax=Paraburkholderia bannensis TaxID=765414 RepID=UPI002AC32996|nr:hypothetical protein [Paraburkholderia bannensis]
MPDLVTFLVTAQARDMFYEHRVPVAHGHQIVQNQIRGQRPLHSSNVDILLAVIGI